MSRYIYSIKPEKTVSMPNAPYEKISSGYNPNNKYTPYVLQLIFDEMAK